MNELELRQKGFTLQPDGSWAKRPRAMGAMENPQRKPDQRGESKDCGMVAGPKGVGYCITIISMRRRLVDAHDNLRTGAKPLVDRIAAWLGYRDDSDAALHWQYEQLRTTGPEGVIVCISTL